MKFLWIIAGTLLFLPSCSRRCSSSCRPHVRSVYSNALGYTSTYSYANDGHLSSVLMSNGSVTNYQYSDNRIFGKTTDCAGAITASSICFLNNFGLVDSLVNISASKHLVSKKFNYDASGFAIEEKKYEDGKLSSVTKKAIDAEGNIGVFNVIHYSPYPTVIKSRMQHAKNDTIIITVSDKMYSVYTDFYPDKIKTLTYENYGSGELGKGSKNIERKTVQVSAEGDTLDVTLYRYTFDSKSRVSGCVTYSQNGEVYDSTHVVYY